MGILGVDVCTSYKVFTHMPVEAYNYSFSRRDIGWRLQPLGLRASERSPGATRKKVMNTNHYDFIIIGPVLAAVLSHNASLRVESVF